MKSAARLSRSAAAGSAAEDLPGEGLESPLPGDLRQRELPWLEGKVESSSCFVLVAASIRCSSVRRELSLPLDRPKDRLLSVRELPGLRDASGDPADLDLVEPSGLVAAIPGDEGNGVPLVEQLYHRFDTANWQAETLGDRPRSMSVMAAIRLACAGAKGPDLRRLQSPGQRRTPHLIREETSSRAAPTPGILSIVTKLDQYRTLKQKESRVPD
jgi:hypothetical protein